MRVYQKVLSFMALVILFSHNIHASTCDSISLKLMEQTWREFRAIHPFGFQIVGLKHYGDTCVFVMSEPAEWLLCLLSTMVILLNAYSHMATMGNCMIMLGA